MTGSSERSVQNGCLAIQFRLPFYFNWPSIYLDFETKLIRFLHSREAYWNFRQLP